MLVLLIRIYYNDCVCNYCSFKYKMLKEAVKKLINGYGIDMTVTREAIDEIAARAEAEKTGARGLMTIFERVLRNFKFELPSSGIRSFEVNTDTVNDPEHALQQLLLNNKKLMKKTKTTF